MKDAVSESILQEVIATIDIPESAHDKARARYDDLGSWFNRAESKCHLFLPHIYPQGSFRLGTVTRPIAEDEEYDLDLGCRLRRGITKATHTQKQLKEMVGSDLEAYRVARTIKQKPEEKHRCWRLRYADTLRFHMDTVPSIPESPIEQQRMKESMMRFGLDEALAQGVAAIAGAITDNRMANYAVLSDNWRISNSEGYALWFESRMRLAGTFLAKRALEGKVARIDGLPAHQWKTPLQRCVQLLKRHRDQMFVARPEAKPISVIITTLAGLAYQGEAEIGSALERLLSEMAQYVRPTPPRVPNPVNPVEDFADKWADPKCRHLDLENNFWRWLRAAQHDFQALSQARNPMVLVEETRTKLGSALSVENANSILGQSTGALLRPAVASAGLSFPDKPLIPSKPAGFA